MIPEAAHTIVLLLLFLQSVPSCADPFARYECPGDEVMWFGGTGNTLAAVWGDGRVSTWDLSTSESIVSFPLSPRRDVRFDHYYLGKADSLLLAVYYDGLIEIYDCARGAKVADAQAYYPCGFDANGRRFLFVDGDQLKWLDLRTKETGTSTTLCEQTGFRRGRLGLTGFIVMVDRRSSRCVVADSNSYNIVDQNKIIASVPSKNMGNAVPIGGQPFSDYFIFFEDNYLRFWPLDPIHEGWHIMAKERTPFTVMPDGSAVAYWNRGQLQIEWVASRYPRRFVPMPFRPDLEMAIDGTCVFAVPELRDIPLDPPNALFRCLRDRHAVTIIQMKHDGAVSTFPLRKF